MPFFQATSAKLPLDREVYNVRSTNDLPSAGPYAFSLNDANRLTQIRRNRFWKRGPGRPATPRLDGVDIQWNLDQHAALEMVKAGQLDESWVPNEDVQAVAAQYGVNRAQFWLEPTNCLFSIAFNNRFGIFHANAPLRRAVNFALDRSDFVADLPYAQTPWTHLLPPGFPGSVRKPSLQPYGAHSDLERARQLAAGHYGNGRVEFAYRAVGRLTARAQIVRRDLERLGLTVTMLPLGSGDVPPAGADMVMWFGVCYDLPDSSAVLEGSLNTLWPAGSKYLVRLRAADGLTRGKRLEALGKLDLDITRNAAPVAVMHTYDNRYFFSSRVDPRSLRYHGVYQDWSIPALGLK
jgi:ABC-type transport system substrate-binding protein